MGVRNIDYRFDERYIEDYFKKRREMNRLKNEVDATSKEIKKILTQHGMLYASTNNYNIMMTQTHKVSNEFIQVLKDNNMNNFIVETCYLPRLQEASTILGIDPTPYKEIYNHVLKISKK